MRKFPALFVGLLLDLIVNTTLLDNIYPNGVHRG